MNPFKSSAVALLAMIAAAAFADNASAVVCTWSGATNGNWSVPGNWSCPGGPSTGDDLVFPDGAITLLLNQDIANLSVNSLNFSGSVGTYTLSGTGNLTISGGAAITSKADTVYQNTLALTNPLRFGAATAVIDTTTNNHGTLNLNGPLDLNGSVLSFVWDATVPQTFINGVISGNGGLTVNGIGGNSGLFLSGDNSFTGPVIVNSGYINVNHAHALGAGGSAADGTAVGTGGTFVLGADTTNESLTLAGGGGTSGNGNVQSNGLHVWGGPVVLTNVDAPATTLNLLGSQVTFTGPVSGAGGFLCCNQSDGKIALSNSANTYSGPSDFTLNAGGTLQLLANNALSPNSAVSIGGSTGGSLDMGAFSGTAASFSGTTGSVLNITAGQTLTVTGAVTLNNTALTLTVIGNPALGTVYKIVDKTSAGAISGTFNGLPEGGAVNAGAVGMTISYVGGNGNDVTLTVSSNNPNSGLVVTKPGSGSGTVTGSPGVINCGLICSDTYPNGTQVTLSATPLAGGQFTGWLGPCTGTGTCIFTINGTTTATATFAASSPGTHVLDIDANGSYDALTDGILAIRYLFGLSGSPLITGAVGPGAARFTAADLGNYLADVKPFLDIDGNGQADPFTDGILVARYLFGIRGASLIAGAVGTGAIRATAPLIEAQIQSLKP